jgi:uncharacterized membrane protein YfcA
LVPVLAAGAVLGAPAASWLALKLPHQVLVEAFALFLLANAIQIWIRAARSAAVSRTKLAE